jgi:hypothetical protein
MTLDLIDLAAEDIRLCSVAFTRRGLYHAFSRRRVAAGRSGPWTFERFCEIPLARRLRRGPIPGLLQSPSVATKQRPLPAEWRAYYPAAILLVDRAEIVDLFAASGVLVQARMAVVCIDGSPSRIVNWLRHGWRAGHRAPVGYLHNAGTVVYPFLFEPLATFVRHSPEELVYKDLGIGPGVILRDPLGVASEYAGRATELDEVPPCSLIAYAATQLAAMIAADPLLAPIDDNPLSLRRNSSTTRMGA